MLKSTFLVGLFSGTVTGAALFDLLPALQQRDNLLQLCFVGCGLAGIAMMRCRR